MKKIIIMLCVFVVSNSAFATRLTLPFMGRLYTLVTPNNASEENRPLVVLLHGCTQSSKIILDGTGFEDLANKYNFFVLAPEQSFFYNVSHCWNWFFSFQQERSAFTEMGQIITALDVVSSTYKIDREKIFVAGLSAGGALTHSLAVCYSDYFKGAAIHSGLAYKTAENFEEAQKVLLSDKQKDPNYLGKKAAHCMPTDKKSKLDRIMIIHGQEDSRVGPIHAELISKTNESWFDFSDDDLRNHSVGFDEKIDVQNYPNQYVVTKVDRTYSNGIHESRLIIKGLAHAWGGRPAITRNFDPEAPSSNEFILNFFNLK